MRTPPPPETLAHHPDALAALATALGDEPLVAHSLFTGRTTHQDVTLAVTDRALHMVRFAPSHRSPDAQLQRHTRWTPAELTRVVVTAESFLTNTILRVDLTVRGDGDDVRHAAWTFDADRGEQVVAALATLVPVDDQRPR